MDERFPRVFLVIVGFFTVAILVVGAIGLWDEGGPVVLPEDHLERLKSEAEKDPVKSEDGAPVPPNTTDRSTTKRPALKNVDVIATWKRLSVNSAETAHRPAAAQSLAPAFPIPPWPEVQGRFLVHTLPEDGAISEVRVEHGTPLTFTVEPAVPGKPTTVMYQGRGRHARILTLVTLSGARVHRFFEPRAPGAPAGAFWITAPGTLEGTVVDERDRTVIGAIVQVGDATAATDSQGRFKLAGVRGKPVLAYVTAPGFAPHRAFVETPQDFGTRGPGTVTAHVRLRQGVRLTVDAHLPDNKSIPAPGFTFYLIPFAHRLALGGLATEKMGPYRADASGALVVTGIPRGVDLALVGIHPEMNVIYRRLEADTADVRLTILARPRSELTGVVRREDNGQAVTRYQLTTSLERLCVGDYLGYQRKIPTGHEPGTFPLPTMDVPLLAQQIDKNGRFHLGYDGNVRQQLALRVSAPGLTPAIVPHVGLARELTVKLTASGQRPKDTARVVLIVNLANAPEIRSMTCEGIEGAESRVMERGHAEATVDSIALGQYEITVTARGYQPYTRSINLSTRSTRTVRVFLPQR
jgi:hypothetical protein